MSMSSSRTGRVALSWPAWVPLTKRGGHYGLVPPDKITIFQGSIEARYRDEARITALIGRVVRHEIAHHFGISDGRLKELEGDEDY
jgi:predicted Zn-dependent protease with MMP-like domain